MIPQIFPRVNYKLFVRGTAILQNVYGTESGENGGFSKVLTPRKIKENHKQNRLKSIGIERKKDDVILWENGNYQKLYTFSTWFSTRGNPLKTKRKNKI